jgi:NADPH2:quinone reductase
MKAVVLSEVGVAPRFTDFPSPEPGEGQIVIDVTAAGVHHFDLARTSGTHHSGKPVTPSVVGSDGVGRTADGRRVFFDTPVAPYGSWAQRTLVSDTDLFEPAEGVDDVTAAALGNTGMAAWLALSWRARLQPGETVLVLGAGGAVGSVAVQAAKVQGAGRVIAADRDPNRLRHLRERGADATVVLDDSTDLPTALQHAAGESGVNVIIDSLWGEPALAAMRAAAPDARHIEIGNSADATITLPAPTVRATSLNILGFAFNHAPQQVRREAYRKLTEYAAQADITVDISPVPLADVATAWDQQRHGAPAKLVLIP